MLTWPPAPNSDRPVLPTVNLALLLVTAGMWVTTAVLWLVWRRWPWGLVQSPRPRAGMASAVRPFIHQWTLILVTHCPQQVLQTLSGTGKMKSMTGGQQGGVWTDPHWPHSLLSFTCPPLLRKALWPVWWYLWRVPLFSGQNSHYTVVFPHLCLTRWPSLQQKVI